MMRSAGIVFAMEVGCLCREDIAMGVGIECAVGQKEGVTLAAIVAEFQGDFVHANSCHRDGILSILIGEGGCIPFGRVASCEPKGDFAILQFTRGGGRIQLRLSRLFPTKEAAADTLPRRNPIRPY